jgi:hypothetical protein
MKTMPEAYSLRRVPWQLFVTLTFQKPPKTRSNSLPRVFKWLRKVSRTAAVYFPQAWWALRFEFGSKGGHGHYHILIAGIPQTLLCENLCRTLEDTWRACGGGLSEITLYDPARDGVGYVLKLPAMSGAQGAIGTGASGMVGDDCEPMLSRALLHALSNGRI